MRCKSPLMPQQISSIEPQENAAQSASGRQYKTHGALHGHSTKLVENASQVAGQRRNRRVLIYMKISSAMRCNNPPA